MSAGGLKLFSAESHPEGTQESRWAPGSRRGLTPNGTPKPLGNASTLCICATRCSSASSRAFAAASSPATHHAPPASSPLHTVPVVSDTVLPLSLSSVGRLSIRTRPPGRSRLASQWLQHLRRCRVQAQAPASCAGHGRGEIKNRNRRVPWNRTTPAATSGAPD